jgi:hypothetical protein
LPNRLDRNSEGGEPVHFQSRRLNDPASFFGGIGEDHAGFVAPLFADDDAGCLCKSCPADKRAAQDAIAAMVVGKEMKSEPE